MDRPRTAVGSGRSRPPTCIPWPGPGERQIACARPSSSKHPLHSAVRSFAQPRHNSSALTGGRRSLVRLRRSRARLESRIARRVPKKSIDDYGQQKNTDAFEHDHFAPFGEKFPGISLRSGTWSAVNFSASAGISNLKPSDARWPCWPRCWRRRTRRSASLS